MDCSPAALIEAARGYKCIPLGEQKQVAAMLWCRLLQDLQNLSPTPPPTPPAVVNWVERVVINGGDTPSEITIVAMSAFYNSLVSCGIDGKMIAVNCLVPDNLIAAITPLIAGVGNDPWTNNGFVGSSLTVNGLHPGAIPPVFLDTGIVPSTVFPSVNDGGLTVYGVDSTSVTYTDIGFLGGGNHFALEYLTPASGNQQNRFPCWNNAAGAVYTPIASPPFVGFISGNRISATSSDVYFANSTTPFYSAAHIATSGGSRPTGSLFAFTNSTTGVPSTPNNRRLSFIAIHRGLTSTECQCLYNAVQTLRVSLGGGWV